MQSEIGIDYMETRDHAFAAYLKMSGQLMIGAHRGENGRRETVYFRFSDRAACEALALTYFNSDFHRFQQEIKAMKSVIFDDVF